MPGGEDEGDGKSYSRIYQIPNPFFSSAEILNHMDGRVMSSNAMFSEVIVFK